MKTAYLKDGVVVHIASGEPPQGLDYDAVADGENAVLGETWTGAVYIPTPHPIEQQNQRAIRANAESAMSQLRAFRDLPSPTTAQKLAFDRLTARVLLGLIRLQLNQMEDVE